jgi:hypothetical protein
MSKVPGLFGLIRRSIRFLIAGSFEWKVSLKKWLDRRVAAISAQSRVDSGRPSPLMFCYSNLSIQMKY